MLRIDIQSENGVTTLHCSGRIVFGLEGETLRSVTKSRPERRLRFDLAGIETIDASGLGLLVELQHWAARERRTLSFANASEFVCHLIVITRLHRVLNMSSDSPCAIPAEQQRLASALSA